MIDLNTLPLTELFADLTKDQSFSRLLAACCEEELGQIGDVTTKSIVPHDAHASVRLVAREQGVVAGLVAVIHILAAFGADAHWTPDTMDGETCEAGETLGVFEGTLAGLLAAERTLLNIVARLAGVATMTRQYVEAVAHTDARICDTRKTAPAMRSLQKYAVRCGGGHLHRIGLFDAALYKDNHIAGIPLVELASRLGSAITAARQMTTLRFVEVEVDSLEQLRQVLTLPAGLVDFVLLDNMPPNVMHEAVAIRDTTQPGVKLEASGGVRLDTVRAIAETGVDRISIGALTHHAPALDLALEVLA